MGLSPISDEANHFFQMTGLSHHLAMIDHAWESALGGLATMARIVAIERSALIVEVDSSPVMQELSLRRKELLRKMNQHFKSEFITHMTIRLATHG